MVFVIFMSYRSLFFAFISFIFIANVLLKNTACADDVKLELDVESEEKYQNWDNMNDHQKDDATYGVIQSRIN